MGSDESVKGCVELLAWLESESVRYARQSAVAMDPGTVTRTRNWAAEYADRAKPLRELLSRLGHVLPTLEPPP